MVFFVFSSSQWSVNAPSIESQFNELATNECALSISSQSSIFNFDVSKLPSLSYKCGDGKNVTSVLSLPKTYLHLWFNDLITFLIPHPMILKHLHSLVDRYLRQN